MTTTTRFEIQGYSTPNFRPLSTLSMKLSNLSSSHSNIFLRSCRRWVHSFMCLYIPRLISSRILAQGQLSPAHNINIIVRFPTAASSSAYCDSHFQMTFLSRYVTCDDLDISARSPALLGSTLIGCPTPGPTRIILQEGLISNRTATPRERLASAFPIAPRKPPGAPAAGP